LRRTPPSVYFITLIGLVLAILMIREGLYIRLFSDVRNPDALWLLGVKKVGIDPLGMGWPWVVLGISWVSALLGVWLDLPWGRWTLWIVTVLSLLYVEIGTILAVLVILGLASPASQRWMNRSHVPETE
jgi:hypothetical protein